MSLNDVTTGIGSLAIRILHRQDADDEEDVVRFFPRHLREIESVDYVMWMDASGGWRTGTVLERFNYHGRAYVRVTTHTGNISMKALLWDEVRYVL